MKKISAWNKGYVVHRSLTTEIPQTENVASKAVRWPQIVVIFDPEIWQIGARSDSLADSFSRYIRETYKDTFKNTDLTMQAIRKTQNAKSFSTNTVSYVTSDLENKKIRREKYMKDDEFKDLHLKQCTST